jgi:hypothetical protein
MTSTARRQWTWDALAEAKRDTLEEVLRSGATPDPAQLDGHTYRGWNRGLLARIITQKFKKAFYAEDGEHWGYNLVVHQDGKGHRGEWKVKTKNGEPERIGWFRVLRTDGEQPRKPTKGYANTVRLDYAVKRNKGLNFPLRAINDFVVLPNPGDHRLLLGKAYLRLGFPWLTVFWCFFLIERDGLHGESEQA